MLSTGICGKLARGSDVAAVAWGGAADMADERSQNQDDNLDARRRTAQEIGEDNAALGRWASSNPDRRNSSSLQEGRGQSSQA